MSDGCKFGVDPSDFSCRQLTAECGAIDFSAMCEDSCTDGCVEQARHDGPPIYGHRVDLAHNIVHLYDGDHRMFVENQYGDDPLLPSFDAVKTQKVGDYATEFHYRDLKAEEEQAVSIPTTGPEALADSYDAFQAVDLCPSLCILGPFFPGAVEFVPWMGQLVLLKGAVLGGFAEVTQPSALIPPTVFAYASLGGKVRAQAIVGDERLPTDFAFSFRSDAGVLGFRRDAGAPGYSSAQVGRSASCAPIGEEGGECRPRKVRSPSMSGGSAHSACRCRVGQFGAGPVEVKRASRGLDKRIEIPQTWGSDRNSLSQPALTL
jgi:hypothetical protein